MASLSSRSLSRLALHSRIGLNPITTVRSAVLRRYTSIIPDGSRTSSYTRPFSLQKSFRPPVTGTNLQHRGYADLKASGGKTEADLIVEELQELYDNAKDELEIATDSTNSATIYAASDRESARELLDQLLYVYKVYTEMTRSSSAGGPDLVSPLSQNEQSTTPNAQQANADRLDANAAKEASNPILDGTGEALSGNSYVGITPNYDPEYISVEVKEEVKERVGQRIRELKSAVERLEEMASHE
ncbi:hypothetical protein TSTA_074380 [Talaromyces stipitatus ATCC 10500]|uniref:Uncharacterized protein n=1 Tax=Talaromyces stipitatus (strain ATCC 10500 / CBS 375.48 / QM 6759 / NRRL 1006) TaxID=441959 RepID=B8LW32_TALSN|nr:uncharacterized protein TSTA_074380 [Talaromyces stipitatus ATCC 10500]EED24060.1 hypothetical protein TSTA_074380 [Talaromyces stipitatus ATCC 10500]